MKQLMTGLAMVATLFTACNNEGNTVTTNNTDTASDNTATIAQLSENESGKEMVASYLQLQKALASDNSEEAAAAGKSLAAAAGKMNEANLSSEQKSVWAEVKADISEHAEHIGDNAGKIDHQREHFDLLSRDMYDVVKVVKPTQTLYQAHCPMYNDGKGATWLSTDKTIQNPYYGKKMQECGEIKDTIQP